MYVSDESFEIWEPHEELHSHLLSSVNKFKLDEQEGTLISYLSFAVK